MEFEVFALTGPDMVCLGTCELRYLSGGSIDVLHLDQNRIRPADSPQIHPFDVFQYRDASGERQGLIVGDGADPAVLPGWKAAEAMRRRWQDVRTRPAECRD